MPVLLESNYQFRTGDFDRWQNIKPASVLDVFQDIAGAHAEATGIGFQATLDAGYLWIVTRVMFEVVKIPELHQQVVAKTWPYNLSRLGFSRDYSIRSLSGELLIKGTSEWVIIDVKTRKLANMLDYYKGSTDFLDERMFEKKLRKIGRFTTDRELGQVRPTFSDIDMNGHVNNSKYAEYVLNAFEPPKDTKIKSVQLDFKQEVREDEMLSICAGRDGNTIYASGIGAADGAVRFNCKVELG